MTLFEFTCYINPPTKNEKNKITVFSRKLGRKVPIVNPEYKKAWELIDNQMFLAKYKITKQEFTLLPPKKRAALQSTLSDKNVIVSLWNGFHRMDAGNFWDELVDRLQGIAYKNDRQIKEYHVYKDDESPKEYFKIIVEEMECQSKQ